MEPESFLVFSAIMFAAAFDAGHTAGERPDTGENGMAFRAGVEEFSFDAAAFEREFMATRLVGDPKIPACLPPLWPVSVDPAPARPVLGKEVGELMSQGTLNLGG